MLENIQAITGLGNVIALFERTESVGHLLERVFIKVIFVFYRSVGWFVGLSGFMACQPL